MIFENDIFIGYPLFTDGDNQEIKEWTKKFCHHLSFLMERLYNKKPSILLHEDLRTRQAMLGENILEVYSKTAIFVLIIAPEFLNSQNYIKELEDIVNSVAGSDEHSYKGHRIFKVITTPLPANEQPDFLSRELSYNFYEINHYSKRPLTLKYSENDKPVDKFWSKLVDLAYDIADVLELISWKKPGDVPTVDAPAVFLAETTHDQTSNRDMLKRELQHLGYSVLPQLEIPYEADSAKETIEECLKQSVMSIHLLGAWYGDFVKNSKYSLTDLQIKTVKDSLASKGNNAKSRLIIWIPNDIKPTDLSQLLYLKRLKRDEAQRWTEIVETPFEVFKTILNSRLDEFTGAHVKPVAEKNRLYIIYEKPSEESLEIYINQIKKQGFKVVTAGENGEDFFPLSKHINYMLTADAVLIYKGESTMEWLNSKIRDLVKAPGYGKSLPFRAIEIISKQKTADKSLLFLKSVSVNWDEEINHDVVNHFLDHLIKK